MLIINVKDSENIDRALKRYKRKHRKVGMLRNIRNRKHYTKPSDERRNEVLKAIYKRQKAEDES
ncbi:MAG: 30S ribosomal protein S21 [Bacteroidetes bacterium]|jgi:small subunit ribosomal protein S21|nr:30S ribosomal protein S21 [Bacteroidota bacterium]